ncbi:MAG: addiction module protein [Planctomycetota bacterium]
MNTQQLREAVLSLPEGDRADLARDLLRSLDGPPDSDAREAWLDEIQGRARELVDGSVSPIDWGEARDRITRRLRERGAR